MKQSLDPFLASSTSLHSQFRLPGKWSPRECSFQWLTFSVALDHLLLETASQYYILFLCWYVLTLLFRSFLITDLLGRSTFPVVSSQKYCNLWFLY